MFSSLRGGSSQASSSTSTEKDPFASILSTSALRIEFTLLVMLCTNVMRDRLLTVFDAAHTSSLPSPHSETPPTALPGDQEDLPPSYHTATSGRGRQDYDRRDEELSQPETLELRRAALAHLNQWRTAVLRRVGEVLSVRADTILRAKEKRDLQRHPADSDSKSPVPEGLSKHYALLRTSLTTSLSEAQRSTLLSSLLLLLLSLETYSAHSRTLLCHMATSLHLPTSTLNDHESKVAEGLLATTSAVAQQQQNQMSAESSTRAVASANAPARAWKVGLATVAGAALIGVTGGLAAPLIAASLGGIFGALGLGAAAGLLGGLAGNVVLIGGLFGAYGGRMTGRMVDRYARDVEDFGFVPLHAVEQVPGSMGPTPASNDLIDLDFPSEANAELEKGAKEGLRPSLPPRPISIDDQSTLPHFSEKDATPEPGSGARPSLPPRPISIDHHSIPNSTSQPPFSPPPAPAPSSPPQKLRLSLSISGWLTSAQDITSPWSSLSPEHLTNYSLRWETLSLLRLGTSLSTLLKSAIWDVATAELVRHTLLATLAASLWPLGLLRAAGRVVDNDFSVAKHRADKAGLVLADALANRVQGERPVVLVGFGLGARVIWACCLELAKRRVFGVVESIVLMGAPVPSDPGSGWRAVRAVVAGRVANAYAGEDWVLGLLYRTSSVQLGVAGLQAVNGVAGVENFDVGGVVGGHLRYRWLAGRVLVEVGMEEVDRERVREREEEMVAEERKEEREKEEKERAKKRVKEERIRSGKQELGLIDLDGGEGADGANVLSEGEIRERIRVIELGRTDGEGDGEGEEGGGKRPPLPPRQATLPGNSDSQQPQTHVQASTSSKAATKSRTEITPEPAPQHSDDHEEEESHSHHAGIQMVDAEAEAEANADLLEKEVEREMARVRAANNIPSSSGGSSEEKEGAKRESKGKKKVREEKGEMQMLDPEDFVVGSDEEGEEKR